MLRPPLSPPPPQLDWPALVQTLIQALDDIGCRPRQFTALQSAAIRAAQIAAGLNVTLWGDWEREAMREEAGVQGAGGDVADAWLAGNASHFFLPPAAAESLHGVPLGRARLLDVHLVPAFDPYGIAHGQPWINVRAKCSRDESPFEDAGT